MGTHRQREYTHDEGNYANAPKTQTQYAAGIHTNMALDLKTNRTTNARLATVHLNKFLASTRIL
jgi:hypothetical protein